jgi:ATP-dependent helicase HrpB
MLNVTALHNAAKHGDLEGIRVRIQVLAPSNRPVQITENLGDFWRDTYPKLKQQLQRRYPKHEWR